MFDTMTMTKLMGGLCGAFLVFLLGGFAAEFIYHEPKSHGDGDEHHQAYTIDTGVEEVEEVAEVPFEDVYASADAASGERLFRQCSACHKIEDGANGTGPHLFNVVNRAIGSIDGFGYSGGFADVGEAWTPENLNAFLANPKAYAPDTKMTYKGMAKIEDRANLIAWLEGQGG